MRTIKVETGWELGVEDLWRYEVTNPFHTTTWIEDYMKQHFGEDINDRVVLRSCTSDYLCTLALYRSQQELESNEDLTIFAYEVKLTYNIITTYYVTGRLSRGA